MSEILEALAPFGIGAAISLLIFLVSYFWIDFFPPKKSNFEEWVDYMAEYWKERAEITKETERQILKIMNGHDEEAIRATTPSEEEQELQRIEEELEQLRYQRAYFEDLKRKKKCDDQSGPPSEMEGGEQAPKVPDNRNNMGIF